MVGHDILRRDLGLGVALAAPAVDRRPCRRDNDAAFSRGADAKASGQIGPVGQGAHRGPRQGKARARVNRDLDAINAGRGIKRQDRRHFAAIGIDMDHRRVMPTGIKRVEKRAIFGAAI